MNVMALYDIHGNVDALEAVLAEVEAAAPDVIVVGGDVAAGPLPAETLDRLARLGDRVRWVMGNTDRLLVEAYDRGARPEDAEDPIERLDAWAAQRLTREHRDLLASFEPVVRVGSALFCHGSPRSDTGIITAITPEARLGPMLQGLTEDVVVCGHTHHQFDRRVLGKRVLNAGSVGNALRGRAGGLLAVARPRRGAPAHGLRHRGGGRPDARLRATGRRGADAARKPAGAGRRGVRRPPLGGARSGAGVTAASRSQITTTS
jgi:putative phosphoesterase